MTEFSKLCFSYINGVASSYRHIYKVLNTLQSGDHLSFSKV